MVNIEALTFSYGAAPLLDNISLQIPEGKISGIIGPNGAGKTTLIKVMAGLLQPQAGSVQINGQPLAQLGRADIARLLAYVPQNVDVHFDFSVDEVVQMGRYPYKRTLLGVDEQGRKAVKEALAAMDLTEFRARGFNALSGGEKQRVLIASALAQQSRLLLLDEPTSALDLRHQQDIYRTVRRLCHNEGKTVITVTHDINLAAQYCDRLIMLHEGRVVRHGSPHDVLKFPVIEEVYGVKVYIDINPFTDSIYILPYDVNM